MSSPHTNDFARVRVRGIYSTAITNLLLKKGFQIVQASRIISDRFSIPQLQLPADVTIKSDEHNRDELLIIGYHKALRAVVSVLREELSYSSYLYSKLPIHATVVARLMGTSSNGCIAVLGGEKIEIVDLAECKKGEKVIAFIVKTALREDEVPRAVLGVEAIGDYAIVSKRKSGQAKVTISEHIRSPKKRASLLALSADYVERGFSIHWRSSAGIADESVLKNHLEELVKEIRHVEEKATSIEEGIVSAGEDLAAIILSSIDKKKLDTLRAEIVPTTPLHHILKSSNNNELSAIADFADKIAGNIKGKDQVTILEKSLIEYIASKLNERKKIPIYHITLAGRKIKLGDAEIQGVEIVGENNLKITVKRTVKSRGLYDGLGIEKEPGDNIITTIDTRKWFIIHRYYSLDGELKGTYININTPPEILTDSVKYIDLEIDIIKMPNQQPKLIDIENFIDALKNKNITLHMTLKVINTIKEISPSLAEELQKKITNVIISKP